MRRSERRRQEAEKAIRGLEATRDVAVAIGGEIALEHVLELIVKRGRALVGARSLVIMLRDGHELVVQASAGHVEEMRGARLPIAESTSGQVLERRRAERITDVAARLRIAPSGVRRGRPADRAAGADALPRRRRGRPRGVRPRRAREACSPRTTSRCCARSRPAPRPPWRSRRACRAIACAARWPPRTPSDDGGRGSFTTRPCRASGACACCSPPHGEAMTSGGLRPRWTRPSSTSSGRSRTCARSSPSCARPPWTSWGCARRSRLSSTAIASRADSRSKASSRCPAPPRGVATQ